jgi:hypothetical protein
MWLYWGWAVFFPVGAIGAWFWLSKVYLKSASKMKVYIVASLPPSLVSYDFLTWHYGWLGYMLSPPQGPPKDIWFHVIAGSFWRVPLTWLLEHIGASGTEAPWVWAAGGSPYFGCFPNELSWKYFITGFTNEASAMCLLACGIIVTINALISLRRHGT